MKGATSCKSYCPPIWNIVLCLIVAFVCLQTLIVFTFIAKTNSDGERIEVHRPRYKRVIGENIVVQVEKKPTPVQTRVKPVNPFPYHAILVPQEPCNTSDVFLFICVHSAPEHTHKRDFIRETWGNGTQYNKTVRIVFFLGLQDPNHRKPKEIPGEHKQYGDIIQYDFVDSYYNLTLKTLAELQYVSSHCRSASFILKADDDAFINVYELLRFLESKEAMPDRLLLGQSMYIPQIQTLTEVPARMYMSERERPSRYVAFVSGLAYVLTPDTSEKLYRKALTMRYFWIDDVFITGIVRQKAGINVTRFNSAYVFDFDFYLSSCDTVKCRQSKIFLHAAGQPISKVMQLWKDIKGLY